MIQESLLTSDRTILNNVSNFGIYHCSNDSISPLHESDNSATFWYFHQYDPNVLGHQSILNPDRLHVISMKHSQTSNTFTRLQCTYTEHYNILIWQQLTYLISEPKKGIAWDSHVTIPPNI